MVKDTEALPSTRTDDGLELLPIPNYRLTKVHLGSNTYELHLSFGTIRIELLTYSFTDKVRPGSNLGIALWLHHHKVTANSCQAFLTCQYWNRQSAEYSILSRPGCRPLE